MTTLDKTLAVLGGPRVIGREVASNLELADVVADGLPSAALDAAFAHLAPAAIPQGYVYDVVGNERTLQRKRREHGRLSPAESDKLARLARVVAFAEDALGDRTRALRWLRTPNRALDGKLPLALLGSDAGAVVVEQVLERIAHGVIG